MKVRDVLLIVGGVVVLALLVKLLLRPTTTVVKNKSDNPWVAAIDALPNLINVFTQDKDRLPSTSDIDAIGLDSML